jgi:DNA adenine methylase
MHYLGGKKRIAKQIVEYIYPYLKDVNLYFEPFVGSCAIIENIQYDKRYASDGNEYLIELYIALQNGWVPPENISEEEYQYIKNNKDKNKALTAFCGIGCSYSGKWFGGYARGNADNGQSRNYCLESKKNILKQYQGLQGIKIYNVDYEYLDIPDNSIIYCDHPYANTTKYIGGFNYPRFWSWCEKMTKDGHSVFVSEYNAPDNWECVWSKEVHNTLVQDTGSKTGIEKLFVLKT